MSDENLIRVNGTIDETIYAKGDTCLLINPFDTYHLFRIYNNWNTDSRELLNLTDNGQKLYLIFKSSKIEIRIPEFESAGSNFQVDRANGEVLFKITKENANNILAMSSNTFYITRVFEYYDNDGSVIYTSSEEVLFTGNWADESKWTSQSLTAMVNSLKKQLEAANAQILSLTQLSNEYKLQIESLMNENSSLQERVATLEAENEDMMEQIANYESAAEFTSVVISDNATYQYYKGDTEVDENGNPIKKELLKKKVLLGDNSGTIKKLELTEQQLEEKLKNSSLNTAGTISVKPKTILQKANTATINLKKIE